MNPVNLTAVELVDEAVLRIARKTWRCTCTDRILGYRVHATYHGLYALAWTRTGRYASRAKAEDQAAAMRRRRTYTTLTIEEVANRNHAQRVTDCARDINPGDRYIGYLGEAHVYQSGERYCLPCGLATWKRP